MKRLLGTALLAALVLTACSNSPEDAVATFCEAQDDLVTAVENLGSLGVESTSDEVDAVRSEIESSWETYKKAAENVGQEIKAQGEDAFSDYRNAVAAIPDDAPVTERIQMNIDAAKAFAVDLNAIADSVTCS